MPQNVLLVASDDAKTREMARTAAQAEGLEPVLCGDGQEALESAKKHGEDGDLRLMILEAFLPKMDGYEVINRLQEVPAVKGVPVLMLIGPNSAQPGAFRSGSITPQSLPTKIRLRADNYLQKPFEPSEIKGDVHSMNKHFRAHGAPHPVTGLPGHPQLEQEVFSRLTRGETFAMLWADINHYRPFNDHYGTERGDQVLKMLVELIGKIIRPLAQSAQPPFLAHVDGDDFILILEEAQVEDLKRQLREQFQKEILQFYSREEGRQGFFYEKGRDQKDQIFPLMHLSMVSFKVNLEGFVHYGQLVSAANELLRQAKIGAQDVK